MLQVQATTLLAVLLGPTAVGRKLFRGSSEVVPVEHSPAGSFSSPAATATTTTISTTAAATDSHEDSGICSHHGLPGYEISITAECDDEYWGSPQVISCSGTHTQPGNGPWQLTGCVAQTCTTPELTGYVVTVVDDRRPTFHVTVHCDADYTGTAQVAKCEGDNLPFVLSGCVPKVCTPPSEHEKAGYVVAENDLERPSFNVDVTCDEEYMTPAGQNVVATPCATTNQPYHLSGCVSETCQPPNGANEYLLTESSLDRATFNVHAQCAAGYHGHPVVTRCQSHAGHYSVNGCAADNCASPGDHEGYSFNAVSLQIPTFKVSVACTPGYHECESGPGAVVCSAVGQPFQLHGCCSDMCTTPDADDQEGYVVTATNLNLRQASFAVTAQCAPGYMGTATAIACVQPGHPYTLGGCTAESCTTPGDLVEHGYIVQVVNLHRHQFNVVVHCNHSDFYEHHAVATVCDNHGEPYKLEGCLPKVCTAPAQLQDSTGMYTLVSTVSQNIWDFDVQVACTDHYTGTAQAHVCHDHDEQYTLSGCVPVYYLSSGPCPTGEDIILPQECYIASDRLDLGESMSADGILHTEDYFHGCFIKPGTNKEVGFNNLTNAEGLHMGGQQMVCSRRSTPIQLHYAALDDVIDSGSESGVGYCKNNPTSEECCQTWERISSLSECRQAGRALSYDVSSMSGEECIPGLVPGCFFSCPQEDPSMSCVRFNLDTPNCSSEQIQVYQVKHICEKITTSATPEV